MDYLGVVMGFAWRLGLLFLSYRSANPDLCHTNESWVQTSKVNKQTFIH